MKNYEIKADHFVTIFLSVSQK